MGYRYEKRSEKQCPQCEKWFMPKGGRQTCCSKVCARLFDWKRRKPKERIAGPNGYVWRYVENHPHANRLHKNMRPHGGYILEHRYVMEQVLGRYLEPHERVHHRNGKRADNRPENLELWTVNHKDPAGARVVDWVIDQLLTQPEMAALPKRHLAAIRQAAQRISRVPLPI